VSDLNNYIEKRRTRDKEFADNFENGYQNFKIGIILKQAREQAGLTRSELAQKMNTKRSVISRIENHSENICLSTIERYAEALGKKLQIQIITAL